MDKATLIGAVKSTGIAGFEGWASTDQLDRQGDVVMPEAFSKSLSAFKANGPIFWNHAEVHDPLAKPIGRATDARIEKGGLFIKGRWANTAEAQEIRQLVTDGIVSTMSIGYNPVSSRPGKGGVNVIDDLELMEVSIVAIPANPGAVITASKTLAALVPERKDDDADYEAAIRTGLAKVISDVTVLAAAFRAWMGEEQGESDDEANNSSQSIQTPKSLFADWEVVDETGEPDIKARRVASIKTGATR